MKGRKVDVRIFVSYAHRDPPLFRQSLENLLCWPGVEVKIWTDENITPGTEPDQEIRTALDEMDIFVPLISPLFDASRYIQKVEVPLARRRNRTDGVLIAPVVVSHPGGTKCAWLLKLERLPHKKKSWVDIRKESLANGGYDEALQLLRDGIWKLVEQVRSRNATAPRQIKGRRTMH
jgi:TIR domain